MVLNEKLTDRETGMVFDDFSDNEKYGEELEGPPVYTELCDQCVPHESIHVQYCGSGGMECGVEGCHNESEYYYDFWPVESIEIR